MFSRNTSWVGGFFFFKQKTAYEMEYQGQGWMDRNSNQIYASTLVSTAEHPLCPVCQMDVDPATAPKSLFKGKTYYFCSDRKSTRLNSSHVEISYAVFCLKKKKKRK